MPHTLAPAAYPNPMWEELVMLEQRGQIDVDPNLKLISPTLGNTSALSALSVRYSRVVADPELVTFVAANANPTAVMVWARNAYWAYALTSLGLTVHPYAPKGKLAGLFAGIPWQPVHRQDNDLKCLATHKAHTLVLIDPERVRDIARAVSAYEGWRVVVVTHHNHLGPEFEAAVDGWALTKTRTGYRSASAPYKGLVFTRQETVNPWNAATQLIRMVDPNDS